MLFDYKKESTNVFGLDFKPSISVEADDADWIEHGLIEGQLVSMQWKHNAISVEFSENNKSVLMHAVNDLKTRNQLNSILEIGVFRSGYVSSTKTLLDNKLSHTKYFGVDLNEGCLSPVRNEQQNIFCLCENSSNIDRIMNWVRGHGAERFDLIHIDGWHSINQVLKDWRFIEFLNTNGYVLMHDVASHPGPHCVFDAINEEIFEKAKLFDAPNEADWGIAICKKIK